MSRLISTVISGLSHPHFPLVVLESSLVQSCLPVLRAFVNNRDTTTHVLFFSLLYPPSTLAIGPPREGLYIVDRTAEVPGYSEIPSDHADAILNRVRQAPDGPLTVVIDSADVLCADLESPSKSYALIATLLSDLSPRPSKLHSPPSSKSTTNSYHTIPYHPSTIPPLTRALPSRPPLLHAVLPPARSRPRSAPLAHRGAHHRAPARAPDAPRHRAAHAPTPRKRSRALLARLCPAQRPRVGGRADSAGPGRGGAERRRGDGAGGAQSCPRGTRTERRAGVGGMVVGGGSAVFAVRAGQPQGYFRRQGKGRAS